MNGWIIVGTKVDTKELDRQLKNLEKDLIKYGKEYEGLLDKKANIELNVDFKNYLDAKAKLEDLEAKYQEAKKTVGTIDLSQPGSTNLYNNAVEKMSSLRSEMAVYQSEVKNGEKAFEGQIIKLDEINQKIDENIEKQKAVKIEVSKINEKLSEVKRNEMLNSGFDGIKSSIDSVGNSLEGLVKKTVRWGVAIFGVRTAYMFIRQAISSLSQYDEKLATNIEYIRFALASVLKPVIETIINLVYKLLVYIAYIAKAWFGVNLFANASVKAFQSVNKSVKNTNKSAKELQKTLAGFDEMNILQKDGSTKVGGGGGGIPTPDIDLSQWDKIKIPDWVKWIADNRDLILGFLATIAGIIAGIKIAHLVAGLGEMFGILFNMGALKIFGLLASSAITIAGLIKTIMAIIDYIKDPSWANFNEILAGISLTLIGIGSTLAILNASNPLGWVVLGTGAVLSLATAFSKASEKMVNGTANIKSMKKAQEELTQAIKNTRDATNRYVSAVDSAEEAHKELIEIQKRTGLNGEALYNIVQKGDKTYQSLNATQREVYKAYLKDLGAQETLKEATDSLNKSKEEEKQKKWEVQLANANEAKSYEQLRDKIVKAYKDGSLSANEARDLIEKAMSKIDKKSDEVFTKNLPADIKKGLNPDKYRYTIKNFVNEINNIGSLLNPIQISAQLKIVPELVKAKASMALQSIKNLFGFKKGGIIYHNLPKLASGGIINQPGRGVPLGSAIGGERGAEGVIPLTDSQQMDLLGEAIARHMVVNLTNINQMNGRVISRELQKIQNESDFAFNR